MLLQDFLRLGDQDWIGLGVTSLILLVGQLPAPLHLLLVPPPPECPLQQLVKICQRTNWLA